jgi:hypothetical protein
MTRAPLVWFWIYVAIVLCWTLWSSLSHRADKNVPRSSSPATRNDARKGAQKPHEPMTEYQVAVQLVVYEAQHYWTSFAAFLVGVSLLATLLATLLGGGNTDASSTARQSLALAGSVVGLLTCLIWYVVCDRCLHFTTLRIAQARELEAALGFSLLGAGRVLAEGGEVEFGDQQKAVLFAPLTRMFSIRQTALLLPLLLGGLFGLFVILQVNTVPQ